MTQTYTTITRPDADGDPTECDVLIRFRCTHYVPGCPAQTYGPAERCWPAESPEGEFEIEAVEFDGDPAVPGALTEAEIAEVSGWFHGPAGYELAMERYGEELDLGPDPDDARDAALDDAREAMAP